VDGNISLEPLFTDTSPADPLEWDLHLDETSPLVDAGDPSITDPDGGTSDIGAFGGPGAEGWDLDGDDYDVWWLPGAYPGGDWDCDDLDDAVYPGAGC